MGDRLVVKTNQRPAVALIVVSVQRRYSVVAATPHPKPQNPKTLNPKP